MGMLVLVGTPPGEPSERARAALAGADVVGRDDTPDAELLAALRAGATVAVVTDRPRDRLVRAALDAGVPVTAVPGADAAICALAVSGLPSDRFCVEDGPPREPARLATEPRTLVFREPGRLADLAAAFGADRPAVLCGPDGTVLRGSLGELAEAGPGVLVVAGAPAVSVARPDDASLRAEVAGHEVGGTPRRDAITLVARRYGLPRREVYQAVVTR